MSKIKKLIKDHDAILVFDMDGVLSKLEFGDFNHYALNDQEWSEACLKGENFYTEEKVIKRMQKYLSKKNMDNIYVITKVYNEKESEYKELFLTKYYNIKKDHIYYVDSNNAKVGVLLKIKEKYPDIEDYKIAMIEDSVDVLNDVMDKTNFSTIHISSFID